MGIEKTARENSKYGAAQLESVRLYSSDFDKNFYSNINDGVERGGVYNRVYRLARRVSTCFQTYQDLVSHSGSIGKGKKNDFADIVSESIYIIGEIAHLATDIFMEKMIIIRVYNDVLLFNNMIAVANIMTLFEIAGKTEDKLAKSDAVSAVKRLIKYFPYSLKLELFKALKEAVKRNWLINYAYSFLILENSKQKHKQHCYRDLKQHSLPLCFTKGKISEQNSRVYKSENNAARWSAGYEIASQIEPSVISNVSQSARSSFNSIAAKHPILRATKPIKFAKEVVDDINKTPHGSLLTTLLISNLSNPIKKKKILEVPPNKPEKIIAPQLQVNKEQLGSVSKINLPAIKRNDLLKQSSAIATTIFTTIAFVGIAIGLCFIPGGGLIALPLVVKIVTAMAAVVGGFLFGCAAWLLTFIFGNCFKYDNVLDSKNRPNSLQRTANMEHENLSKKQPHSAYATIGKKLAVNHLAAVPTVMTAMIIPVSKQKTDGNNNVDAAAMVPCNSEIKMLK